TRGSRGERVSTSAARRGGGAPRFARRGGHSTADRTAGTRTGDGRAVSTDRRATIAYQPALDGVRAIAVIAVLLFHGEVSWMTGGYLGVSVFFTLSGFLITTL